MFPDLTKPFNTGFLSDKNALKKQQHSVLVQVETLCEARIVNLHYSVEGRYLFPDLTKPFNIGFPSLKNTPHKICSCLIKLKLYTKL